MFEGAISTFPTRAFTGPLILAFIEEMPPQVSASCHDINQDIARYYGIDLIQAFDVSREDLLLNDFSVRIAGNKHNAFYDAHVIKAIYKYINK